jgi:hypothetical protein
MTIFTRFSFIIALSWLYLTGPLSLGVNAWEWSELSDFVSGDGGAASPGVVTLSIQEVSDLRPRDIKRRLARSHGYSAEELAKMLDKKELIHALAFEEEKIRLKQEAEVKRTILKQGIIAALVTLLIVFCWPMLMHAYEVAAVNFVVFTDRKRLEASRCWELKSQWGMLGVLAMGIMDILSVWLTLSVVLSWVMKSKYFFPMPSLSIKPAQMMGGEMANSSLANYGINIGPIVIRWLMSFAYGRIETWTGKALVKAHRAQREAAKAWESEEEKLARKAARKQRKLEKKQREEAATAALERQQDQQQQRQQQDILSTHVAEPSVLPPDWKPSNGQEGESQQVPESDTHKEFLEQLDTDTSDFNDLD